MSRTDPKSDLPEDFTDEFTPEKIAWLRNHAFTAPMFFRALDGIELRNARIASDAEVIAGLRNGIGSDYELVIDGRLTREGPAWVATAPNGLNGQGSNPLEALRSLNRVLAARKAIDEKNSKVF